MISRLIDRVAPLLPIRIAEVDYADPLLLINGSGWSLSVRTAWRVVGPEGLLFSCDSDDVADEVWDLVGDQVTEIVPLGSTSQVDPAFVLRSGRAIEIVSLHPVEPWVFKIGDQVWVASPSDVAAFD